MSDKLNSLMDELKDLEKRIDKEVQERREEFSYKIEQGRVEFEEEQIKKFKELKKSFFHYISESSFLVALTAPVIYFLVIPGIFLDISATIYQTLCFPVYGIPKVNRKSYIVLDRHKLNYLNFIERFNCVYCGYFNGLIAYVREIASRTEQYWCPIRHALKAKGLHRRTYNFLPYGDAKNYHERLESLREDLKNIGN